MFTSLSGAINHIVQQSPEAANLPLAFNAETNEIFTVQSPNENTGLMARMITLISQHKALPYSQFSLLSSEFKNYWRAATIVLGNRSIVPLTSERGERLFKLKVSELPNFNTNTNINSIPQEYIPITVTAKDVQLLLEQIPSDPVRETHVAHSYFEAR